MAAGASAPDGRAPRLMERAALLFPILLLPLMLAVSGDYGATWDEELQQQRGEKIAGYYTGRVGDLEFPEDGAHLYGAPFDVLAVAVQRIVPTDKYRVRHALNAFVGWLGIVFCGLIAHRLFGPGTALLSMILLASMPRYFGHSMNNPKDIPFATLSAAVLYALCRLPARYPFFTWRSASALALATGLALNVRPGALLFLVYAAALLGFRLQEEKRLSLTPVLRTSAWLGGITLATLCVGSIFWPWALDRPVIGPILGLRQVSRFGWIGHVLFNGRHVDALEPVWDYVPRWMLITTPLVTLAGLALALLLLRKRSGQQEKAMALWAIVLFPIVYIIGVRAIIYDGIRHLLFVQPPIAGTGCRRLDGGAAVAPRPRPPGGSVAAGGGTNPADRVRASRAPEPGGLLQRARRRTGRGLRTVRNGLLGKLRAPGRGEDRRADLGVSRAPAHFRLAAAPRANRRDAISSAGRDRPRGRNAPARSGSLAGEPGRGARARGTTRHGGASDHDGRRAALRGASGTCLWVARRNRSPPGCGRAGGASGERHRAGTQRPLKAWANPSLPARRS